MTDRREWNVKCRTCVYARKFGGDCYAARKAVRRHVQRYPWHDAIMYDALDRLWTRRARAKRPETYGHAEVLAGKVWTFDAVDEPPF